VETLLKRCDDAGDAAVGKLSGRKSAIIRLVKPFCDIYNLLRSGDLLIDMPMYDEACSLYTMSL
jgi:hypothetical protein